MKRTARMGAGEAEAMALRALAFLAEDGSRLGRFLAESGMGPADLRAGAGRSETLAAVLDHVLHDESLLLAFTANHGIDPSSVAPAHEVLANSAAGDAPGDGR